MQVETDRAEANGGVATADGAGAVLERRTGTAVPGSGGGRLVSLDAFRGLTIAAMLLVNNPGNWSHIYAPLRHAAWNGWTPTDLIFPFFLFIVGVAMTFSFGKSLERGADRRAIFVKAARRSLILIGLGLLLHGFPAYDLSTIRIPGVLQRIGVASLAATVVVLTTRARGQALTAAALLLGYWALMTLVPVPGSGPGVLEPGRDLGAYLDRLVFGTEHLWAYSETWDPEGLLSTVPAVASVLLGALAGHWIRADHGRTRTAGGLLAGGAVGIAVGALWGAVFPINKNLWTSSYTVFTAGMASTLLAGFYWLIDVRGVRRWAWPFTVYGMNAIAAFFLSSLFARVLGMVDVAGADGSEVALKTYLHQTLFAGWLAPTNASLAFALLYVLFWFGPLALMYRRGIFIKV